MCLAQLSKIILQNKDYTFILIIRLKKSVKIVFMFEFDKSLLQFKYMLKFHLDFTLNDISNYISLELSFYFSARYRFLPAIYRFRFAIYHSSFAIYRFRFAIYSFCFVIYRFSLKDIIPVYRHSIVKYTYTSPKIIYNNDESASLPSQLFEMASGELSAFNVG